MRIKLVVLSALFLFLPVLASAQEGHPLKGTWRGEINMGTMMHPVLIIMDYENDAITGMINPGRSSYRFSNAELDAPNWTLSAAATTRDGVAVSFEATLHEIGARNRYLEGTWTESGRSYPFKITRE